MSELPSDPAERKRIPLCSGVLDYFPAALVEVAKCSQRGNDQHNKGLPLHWAREKSADHLDCALRHILERDLSAAAWRILAALQLQCEADGAPMARGAREAGEVHAVGDGRPARRVFVDGKEVKRVIRADVRGGYVVYNTDVIIGDALEERVLYGHVEVLPLEQQPEHA